MSSPLRGTFRFPHFQHSFSSVGRVFQGVGALGRRSKFCRLFKGSNLQIDTHCRVIAQWSDFPIVSDCVCALFSLFSVNISSPQKTNSSKHGGCLRETFDNHRTMIAVKEKPRLNLSTERHTLSLEQKKRIYFSPNVNCA